MSPELISYYIGILIVMLVSLFLLIWRPECRTVGIVNLLGTSMIAYYFMRTQGFI